MAQNRQLVQSHNKENAQSQGGDGFTWKTPVGAGMVLSGQPIWPKHGGVGGGGTAGKWTSPASKGLRAIDRKVQSTLIKNKVLKQEVKFAAKGIVHRYAGTRGIGAVAGRAVPYVGWGILVWDIGWYLGQNYGISTLFEPKPPESKVLEYMRENGMLDD